MRRANAIRTVRLSPYRPGMGPRFTLETWDTGRRDSRGCTRIGYELRQHEAGLTSVLFTGDDYCPSPLHADDSNATIAGLMNFLTLQPGGTDSEYFANYTPTQLEFCRTHAEALFCEALARFGED